MKTRCNILVCGILILLLLSGCSGTGEHQQNAMPPQGTEPSEDAVYIVHSEAGVIGSWNVSYGAIREDGTMILPIQYPYLEILYDIETSEPRYLQSRETVLRDGVTMTDDLLQQYYQQIYTGGEDTFFEQQWQLFTMDGSPVEEAESCGIRRICGDLILYQDNRLVHGPTGKVLFDDCVTIGFGEDCYIVSYEQYNRVCVMNRNLEVLLDTKGSDGFLDSRGRYLIITKEQTDQGEKQGLCRIDGTRIVPAEYDYLLTYYSRQAPYVQAEKDNVTYVLSLNDGHEVFRTEHEYDYVQEMFEDIMVIQTRKEVENPDGNWPVYEYQSQLYDYNGKPLGKAWESLSVQSELYEQTLRETGEGVLLFNVTDGSGSRYLIDENGRVLYTAENGEWFSVLTEDRIILNGDSGDWICNLEGDVLTERSYENINRLYLLGQGGYLNASTLAVGWYTYNNTQLMDVLDSDGHVLIERLRSVDMLSEDRFWVKKGFSRGMMDESGNWIYEEPLFTSAADE